MEKIELRKLCAKDLFPIMKIISKVGISEFKKCFILNSKAFKNGEERKIGIGVMLDIADVIFKNIGICEKDIYSFLADLSGLKEKEIAELDMAVFAEMITDVVKKEEFGDFFTVVLGLVQGGKATES